MRHLLLPAFLLLLAASALADDWADDYRRGVAALEKGRLRVARSALERAAAAQPEPRAGARAHGTRTFDYLPWLKLSTLAYREGDLEEAAGHLARSLQAGVASSSEAGRLALAKQELLIENLALLRSARAWAATAERDYVTPDDVQAVALAVCSHRIAPTPEAEMQGADTDTIMAAVLDQVPVPRSREG